MSEIENGMVAGYGHYNVPFEDEPEEDGEEIRLEMMDLAHERFRDDGI